MSDTPTNRLAFRSLTRRGFLGGMTLLGVGALVACSSGGGATTGSTPAAGAAAGGAASTSVTVNFTADNKYDPASVTVAKGGTVTWTNPSTNTLQHSATFDPSKAVNKADASLPSGVAPWDSGLIDPGKTATHTFTDVGTYKYFCVPHETLGMLGTIIVQ
jgi:plastocyanin